MSEFTFVLNPSAGRGVTAKRAKDLRRLLRERDVQGEIVFTTRPGEATELARKAGSKYVVAVGGDGTVNEVANGLVGTGKVMGVIPSGSGNDFVKMLKLGRGMASAVDCLMRKETLVVDVGTVACSGGISPGCSPPETRYFVNGVGIGFDAAVSARTREIKHLRGTILYLVAVFQMLGKYVPPTFTISTDGLQLEPARNLLIAIGNGTCAGGGFYLTPQARIDDGLLDVCLVDAISVPSILRLMPKVMRGKHVGEKPVKFLQTKEIAFLGDRDFYVHADGEMVGRNIREVRISLQPRQLEVIVGTAAG